MDTIKHAVQVLQLQSGCELPAAGQPHDITYSVLLNGELAGGLGLVARASLILSGVRCVKVCDIAWVAWVNQVRPDLS